MRNFSDELISSGGSKDFSISFFQEASLSKPRSTLKVWAISVNNVNINSDFILPDPLKVRHDNMIIQERSTGRGEGGKGGGRIGTRSK